MNLSENNLLFFYYINSNAIYNFTKNDYALCF